LFATCLETTSRVGNHGDKMFELLMFYCKLIRYLFLYVQLSENLRGRFCGSWVALCTEDYFK